MSYQVLARKWRPANFSQMVGQEHVLQALANALDSDRLHHAYLFSGTRGVGKTTIARIFAKSLNCEQGVSSTPCGECSSCNEVDQGRSVDLIEIDAASRTGVDDMRELLDNVQYAPTRSRFKIYLIDEVHMLSKHSFNALLKTLEEPPPHIKFLLATTDPQKVPVTVLSRCLQFNLKRMSKAQILSQLQFLTTQETVEADDTALQQLATAADGSMRDALSLLDQAIGYGAGAVRQDAVEAMLGSISRDYLERLLDALSRQQATELVQEARLIIEHNPDYQRVCAEMIALLQQVALFQNDTRLIVDDEFDPGLLQKFAQCWAPEEVQLYYQILLQGRQDLLISPDEAAGFEMLMLRMIAFSPADASIDPASDLKKKTDLSIASSPADPGSGNIPAGSQPAGSQPAGSQPAGSQPAGSQPAGSQPAGSQPAGSQPVEPQPVESQPVESQPVEGEIATPASAASTAVSPSAAAEPAPVPVPIVEQHEADPEPLQTTSEMSVATASIATGAAIDAQLSQEDSAALVAPESVSLKSDAKTTFDWSSIAYELGLGGIAQELAANSELVSYDNDCLQLQLPGELYDIVNELTKAEILEALRQKLGVSLRLEIRSGSHMSGDTPLQAKLLREERERLAAIASIREDRIMHKLQRAFEVELDESSVVKIESNR